MASVEESLFALAVATPAITALIGTGPTRFYPLVKPQNAALPVTAAQRISTVQGMTHDARRGLLITRYQLTTWATTHASMRAVADAYRRTLAGYKGTIAGLRIDAILPDGEYDEYDPITQQYLHYQDFTIIYGET